MCEKCVARVAEQNHQIATEALVDATFKEVTNQLSRPGVRDGLVRLYIKRMRECAETIERQLKDKDNKNVRIAEREAALTVLRLEVAAAVEKAENDFYARYGAQMPYGIRKHTENHEWDVRKPRVVAIMNAENNPANAAPTMK